MPWSELRAKRLQRSRTYRDDAEPLHHHLTCTITPLHYEAVLDSGVYDTELDCTPQRVDNAQLDGWRVTSNGWHYALGQPAGKADGWVGFGGRQGAHWFQFRLLRVGYLHWPTRTWDDIGGLPDYNRNNLSTETEIITVGPNNDIVKVVSRYDWNVIWSTPGGGSLDVHWRCGGDGVKELITINQAGREWVAANRPPTTPLTETWFGFVFQLDWSDVPKRVRDGVEKSVGEDYADDGEALELRDALGRLLGLMPVSKVEARGVKGVFDRVTLRKRFYEEAGNHYLLIGVRCDTLNGMVVGDLVFDPTVNEQVAATTGDGEEYHDTTWDEDGYDSDGWRLGWVQLAEQVDVGLVWTSVAIPNGATIDSATMDWFAKWQSSGDVDTVHKGIDEDNAALFASDGSNRPSTRSKTTATVPETILSSITDEAWYTTSDIATIVAEITSRGGWVSGNNLGVISETTDVNARMQFQDYSNNSSQAAKLDVDYTAVGGNPWYFYLQQL